MQHFVTLYYSILSNAEYHFFPHMILLIQMTIQYSMEFDQAELYKENYTFSALTIEIVDLMIVYRYQ